MTGPKTHARGTRRTLVTLAALVAGVTLAAAPAGADLQGKLSFNDRKAQKLSSGIAANRHAAHSFEGRVEDLQQRLSAVESVLSKEQTQLSAVQSRLRDARVRLIRLRLKSDKAKTLLARQAVANYQADQPSIVTVLLNAHGFADLLERVDAAKTVAKANANVTRVVRAAKAQTTKQAARLAALEAQRAQQTAAVLSQRNQVAEMHLEVANRQLRYIRASQDKQSELEQVQARRSSLRRQIAKLQARQAAAVAISQGLLTSAQVPDTIPGFAPHGGSYGFFQASGTNYSVGDEPRIVARLDALGKALHLRLTGLSGYRTPQHSVEVGGFPNDPHTRGEASDTPGVEGVPEATLNSFGLTRPFPGARELNHVQLVGSI